MYKPPPAIAELLNDYFTAEEALAEASGPVFFRGQLVTDDTLLERLNDEAVKQGIDEDELGVAFTHMWNTPPA